MIASGKSARVAWLAFGVLGLVPAVMAGPVAGRIGGASGEGHIVEAKTVCDYRGCFGFGEQQWHRRSYVQPNFQPPTATGPVYVRPDAAGPARPYYAPVAPPVAPPVVPSVRRQAPAAVNSHVEWCRNQYRSYNPATDRFITYEGVYKTCDSPYR